MSIVAVVVVVVVVVAVVAGGVAAVVVAVFAVWMHRCVAASLCRCIVVSLSPCFAVSSYRSVAYTFSGPGGDSGKPQELSWTLSCTTMLRRRRSPVLIETAEDSASHP